MKFGRAVFLFCGAVLCGIGAISAQAQSACPYLTQPGGEDENGSTRANQWAEGTTLCYHSRVLRCAAAAWRDIGECPDSADWQALEATRQEQNARPVGVTTLAPPIPPQASTSAPTQTVVPEIAGRRKDLDTTLMGTGENTQPLPKGQEPAAEGTSVPGLEAAPPSQPAPATNTEPADSSVADCSDMQRLSFERVFNKSIAESQHCQADCTTDDCKLECKNQHDNVRGPQIMERFHSDACSSVWYP